MEFFFARDNKGRAVITLTTNQNEGFEKLSAMTLSKIFIGFILSGGWTVKMNFCFFLVVVIVSINGSFSVKKDKYAKNLASKKQQVYKPVTGGGTVLQASPLTTGLTTRQDTPHTGDDCKDVMDLLLVFDASHSVTQLGFTLIKNRVLDMVNQLPISPQGTHVAILKYSTSVSTFFMFEDLSVKSKTRQQIASLTFDNGWSRLDLALQSVVDHVFTPAAGARPDVPKVTIVFTDGKVLGPREPDRQVNWRKLLADPVDKLRDQGVTMFSVSLDTNADRVDYFNLDLIAGDRARVFDLNKLNLLRESLGRIAKKVCPATSPAALSSTLSATPSTSLGLTSTPILSASPTLSITSVANSTANVASSSCSSTTSTCTPTSTCYPPGVTPCVRLYLVQVCNTYISTTPCPMTQTPPSPSTSVSPSPPIPTSPPPPGQTPCPGAPCSLPIVPSAPITPMNTVPPQLPPCPTEGCIATPPAAAPAVAPLPNVSPPCPGQECPTNGQTPQIQPPKIPEQNVSPPCPPVGCPKPPVEPVPLNKSPHLYPNVSLPGSIYPQLAAASVAAPLVESVPSNNAHQNVSLPNSNYSPPAAASGPAPAPAASSEAAAYASQPPPPPPPASSAYPLSPPAPATSYTPPQSPPPPADTSSAYPPSPPAPSNQPPPPPPPPSYDTTLPQSSPPVASAQPLSA